MTQDSVIHEGDRVISDPPILTTKLYRPPVTPDLIPRERLLALMERNREQPLTLISAPAGYGKSVLARTWLHTCDCPSAWVSLDENDDDLITFLRYLLAALSRALPSLNLKTWALLNTPSMPDAPVVAHYLLNDLAQIETPFILALDDLHSIKDQAIYDLLTELLRHPAPALHLVLISRTDPPLPIASLRASQKVAEIRAYDLKFTPAETAQLLRNMLSREVGEDLAVQWTQKTEGWVTGLRLAALSLRQFGQEQALHANLPTDSRYLQDYLLAEVLAHLPVASQGWLLKSALLDRFCASLIEAVCGTDADPEQLTGQNFIDWLERENLFLIPLDDNHQWFRFQHLFQQFLKDMLVTQLSPEDLDSLFRRASAWFAEKDLIEEALRYALAARDNKAGVQLVAQYRHQLINAERWKQLSRWIGLFPDDVVDNDPILAITKAHLPSSYGQEEARLRSRANQLVADLPAGSPVAREVKGEITYFDILWSVLTGPPAVAIEQANDALALLPQRAEYFRSSAIGMKALGLQMSGDYQRGVSLINETLNEPEWSATARAKLLTVQSYIFFFEGDLKAAQLWASESLKIASKIQLWNTIGEGHYLSGISHYLRNEIDKAESHLSFLVENRLLCPPIFVAQGVCALTRMYHTQRQPEKASEVFGLAFSHLEEIENKFTLDILHAFQVELALDQDDLALARRLYQLVDIGFDPPVWYHYMLQLTPIKLWLAEGSARGLEKALTALEGLNQQLLRMKRKPQYIDILALQSLVYEARGDRQKAGESLTAALRLGWPGGFIRSFADLGTPMANLLHRLKGQGAGKEYAEYIDQILAAFPADVCGHLSLGSEATPTGSQSPNIPLTDPLTGRELQVLKLLATDLPMRDIAARLYISTGTLNSHTKNIYSKMGVHKRAQAVQQGKALGLI